MNNALLREVRKYLYILTGIGLAAALTAVPCSSAFAQGDGVILEMEKKDVSNTALDAAWPQGPEISSISAIVIEENTGTVLYEKNAGDKLLPSSSVKIMTCLVALEHSSLEDEVVMTNTGVAGVTDGGASISAQIDEVFTMEQCLYAIMLASANDMALQVAEHIGGSVDAFVKMMNEKAADLGCQSTHFVNPTGLPGEGQETTAHDLALTMKAAMDIPTFYRIASSVSYTIPATNLSGGSRVMTNMFTMINPGSGCYYEACTGGKEGYTYESGSVLVCMAEKNDMKLTCAVMGGVAGSTDDEAVSLLDFCFNSFKLYDPGKSDFSVVSGGQVVIPAEFSSKDVTYQDAEREDGLLDRVYFAGSIPVGHAVAQAPEVQDDTLYKEGQKHMEEALAYSESHSSVPYVLIAIGGVALLAILGRLLYKTLSKKPQNPEDPGDPGDFGNIGNIGV